MVNNLNTQKAFDFNALTIRLLCFGCITNGSSSSKENDGKSCQGPASFKCFLDKLLWLLLGKVPHVLVVVAIVWHRRRRLLQLPHAGDALETFP